MSSKPLTTAVVHVGQSVAANTEEQPGLERRDGREVTALSYAGSTRRLDLLQGELIRRSGLDQPHTDASVPGKHRGERHTRRGMCAPADRRRHIPFGILVSMSARKAWTVSLLVGILWVVGSTLLISEMSELTPMKNGLFVAAPAVLIVMALRNVLQLRSRKAFEENGSGSEAGGHGSTR